MLKMEIITCLAYFYLIFASFVASHDRNHQPYRPDTNPDMDLMPLTRYRSPHTTPRALTTGIRDPIMLPVPFSSHPGHDEDYEYYGFEDEDTDTSSGYVHPHTGVMSVTTPEPEYKEYIVHEVESSNAKNDHLTDAASGLNSWKLPSLYLTLLLLMLL